MKCEICNKQEATERISGLRLCIDCFNKETGEIEEDTQLNLRRYKNERR